MRVESRKGKFSETYEKNIERETLDVRGWVNSLCTIEWQLRFSSNPA